MTYIGRRLREAREARGLTQDQLGELAWMTRTDISAAENDKLSIGVGRLQRLADALDVSVLELAPEAEPDARGQVLADRLAELEASFAAELRRRERALRAVTRRLAELEGRLALLEQRGDHPQTGRGQP